MLGVMLEESSTLLGDNMAVVVNTSLPSSALKKKHQACNYHRVREAIATRIINFGHIDSTDNLADVCTKPLGPTAYHSLSRNCMFRRPQFIDELSAQMSMDKVRNTPIHVASDAA